MFVSVLVCCLFFTSFLYRLCLCEKYIQLTIDIMILLAMFAIELSNVKIIIYYDILRNRYKFQSNDKQKSNERNMQSESYGQYIIRYLISNGSESQPMCFINFNLCWQFFFSFRWWKSRTVGCSNGGVETCNRNAKRILQQTRERHTNGKLQTNQYTQTIVEHIN